MAIKSPIPPGAFVELAVENIDEGKFRRRLNAQIRRAVKELLQYEKESEDSTGKAVITAQLQVFRTKGTKDHFNITHAVKIATPSQKNVSVVKVRGEKLLCQPTGSSQFDPDQMVIFDSNGRPIGGTDPDTGESIEQSTEQTDVAGKIDPAIKTA